MTTCSVCKCSRRLIVPPIRAIFIVEGNYNDFVISFNFDSRSIRSKKELCLKLDERACLVSRSATRLRSLSRTRTTSQ